MIQQYKAREGQTIYDICLMTYGSIDRLFKLMQDNGFPGVNAYPVSGSYFAWDDTLVFDQKVNITNSAQNVIYSTRASDTGGVYYGIQEPGAPSGGTPTVPVPPVIPPDPGPGVGYFYIFPDSPGISIDGDGNFVYTDRRLKDLSGYPVYATQFPGTLNDVPSGLTYDPAAGSFTVHVPDFSIVDGYRLVVYTNAAPLPDTGFFYVFPDSSGIGEDIDGNFTYTDNKLKGLANYSIYATQLSAMINDIPPGLTFDATIGVFTIKIPDFAIVTGYRLIVFTNLIGL